MKTYVISDIHGQWEAYESILSQIDFPNFAPDDRLYILGDVIDRGFDSIKILQHIRQHPKQITMLLGNHEMMMLQSLRPPEDSQISSMSLWQATGGDSTYTEFQQHPPKIQEEILDFLQDLPDHVILERNGQKFYLVHAMPHDAKAQSPRTKNMGKQEKMLWGTFESYHKKKVTVVFGHRCSALYDKKMRTSTTPPEQFAIYHQDNFYAIDCGCAYQNKLSRLGCLRLEDFATFYGILPHADSSVWW